MNIYVLGLFQDYIDFFTFFRFPKFRMDKFKYYVSILVQDPPPLSPPADVIQYLVLREMFLLYLGSNPKKCHKKWKQAGAELGQAQV